MSFTVARWKLADFLVVILFLQFIVYVMVFFGVPVAGQVIGFIYLTFVPGFVVIKLLKLNELDGLETVLFSVGLSVAFLTLTGLLVNGICPLFGINRPLSLMPLTIILNGLILVGGVVAYLRNEGIKLWEIRTFRLHPFALLLILLPILSVIGVTYVNAYNNNSILLFVIIAISLLFMIAVTSKRLVPPKFYPIAIFVIALSLLYHYSLVSNYMTSFGSDVPREYFLFRSTQENAYWASTNPYKDIKYGRTHSMLSVTILPTIYSNSLNVDPALVFKILYPLIFSFVPIVLYKLWKEGFGSKYAFISTFLFMSNQTFYVEMLGLNRQMIAELFFVLLLFTILNKKMKNNSKMICFMIFSVALITSHYGLAEIFVFFVSFALIFSVVMKRPGMNITTSMVIFFFVVMFSWYIHTASSATFSSILSYGEYVYNSLGDFFNPAARDPLLLRGLGLEPPPTIWNAISRGFAYVTEFFIVVGFVGLIKKRGRTQSSREFFIFSLPAMVFLVLLISVPGLATTMNMTRFYHVLLFFLAPLCVVGAEFLAGLLFKRKRKLWASIILLIVLVPYFLFQTGFVYEVTQSDSWSLPLSKHRMEAYRLRRLFGYVDERDVFSAHWLSKNVDTQNTQIHADISSRDNVLTSYGMILRNDVIELTNVTSVTENGAIYLSRLNVIDEIIVGTRFVWNKTEFRFLGNMNKVYTNGGSEIYGNIASFD